MKKIMSIIISICLLAASCPALAASAADFSDVKSSDWYYSAVDYVTGMGLFSGTSATAFSPKRTMNRAMFVTVLGRYAGVSGTATADVTEAVNMRSGPGTDSSVVTVLTAGSRVNITGLEKGWYAVTKGSSSGYVRSDLLKVNNGGFSDVSGASYYCAYVNWCSANGIAGGTGGTSFSPSAAITREQICAILYRYAQKFGVSLPETVSAAAFSDDAAISASARDGVYAMQRAGVVSGRGGNAFCPRATASRAEVAAIMMRFIECVKTQPKPDYGYAGTVPASAAAADGYFDDACFIGHSIVVGMSMYLGLPNAQYYAVNGISAKRMLTYDGFTLPDGGTGTVSDALTGSSFGKVYIMLGVNELGSADYDLQSYYDSMISLISMVKDKLPQAKIYLISIMPVTQTESDSSQNYNLQNIVRFNTKLQQISRETGAGYLDFFTLFADSDGYMPPECTASDGIHPLQSQYAVMNGYIKTHT
jgi:hypothetical protein